MTSKVRRIPDPQKFPFAQVCRFKKKRTRRLRLRPSFSIFLFSTTKFFFSLPFSLIYKSSPISIATFGHHSNPVNSTRARSNPRVKCRNSPPENTWNLLRRAKVADLHLSTFSSANTVTLTALQHHPIDATHLSPKKSSDVLFHQTTVQK
jgi:hypothetical protein